jgi:hypothetical protein
MPAYLCGEKTYCLAGEGAKWAAHMRLVRVLSGLKGYCSSTGADAAREDNARVQDRGWGLYDLRQIMV